MVQGVYWMATIPYQHFTPYLPEEVIYIKGQLEIGANGFRHWQIMIVFKRSVRLAVLKRVFGDWDSSRYELTKSKKAEDYVWKEDTRVAGTQFELGTRAFKRSCKRDWDEIRDLAKSGNLEGIDAQTYVCHYRYPDSNSSTLHAIARDHLEPIGIERTVRVFWGPTGTGKSRRAWAEAGLDAYPKDPRSKFWDGYRGQEHVVVDEFRGSIDIAHLLRWVDRYPVIVEVKGSSVCLMAKTMWLTSNLNPREWYPELDNDTRAALFRRLEITHFDAL